MTAPQVGDWVRLTRPAPDGQPQQPEWRLRRTDPSLVIHVDRGHVSCAEPLTKPERRAHEFWSAPIVDVEVVDSAGPAPTGQSWWQRCLWETVGTDYTPPTGGLTMRFADAWGSAVDEILDLHRKALQGFTTVTQRCTRCGRVEARTLLGRVTGVG